MSKALKLKEKISRAVDEAGVRARDIAKSIGLLPNPPRLSPVPIPAGPTRRRR